MAAYLGWRRRHLRIDDPAARLEEACLWLALLNLGSLRSPFVPDAYAFFGSVWLAILAWAGLTRHTVLATLLVGALAVGFTRVFDGLLAEGSPTPTWMLGVTLAVQLSALAFNAWVLWRVARQDRARDRISKRGRDHPAPLCRTYFAR